MPAINIIANLDDPKIAQFKRHGESASDFTDRLIFSRRGSGRFRQCAIGWHDECSDIHDNECTCDCHKRWKTK